MTAKEVLHAGWLTKSPPERKTHGPWRFFKSQWRRRYFVLSAVHASAVLPGSCPAHLLYYDNEKMAHQKGSINLDNCEQVVVHLESEYYKHVFIVRTTDHGHNRTYYLAADNEMDMERWVDQLCKLLGLRPDEESPAASSRLTHSKSNVCVKSLPVNPSPRRLTSVAGRYISNAASSRVANDVDPVNSPPTTSVPKQHPEDYLPLDQCSSGSVPPTPPRRAAPVKIVTIQTRREPSVSSSVFSANSKRSDDTTNTEEDNDDNDNGPDDVYNRPKNWNDDNRDSNVYNLPRPTNRLQRDSNYDYPPTSSSQEWKRDSTYDYPANGGGGGDDNEDDTAYAYPPPNNASVFHNNNNDDDDADERPIWECESRSSSRSACDTYDVTTSTTQSIDRRSLRNGSSRESNFKSTGLAPIPDDNYDIPSPSFNEAPPKPHLMPPRVHRYVNAPPVPVSNSKPPAKHPTQGSIGDDVYLVMASIDKTRGDVYTTMDKIESSEHRHENAKQLQGYQAETRNSGAEVANKLPKALPRTSVVKHVTEEETENSDVIPFHVKGNQRTRSFKRNISNTTSDDIPLPQKKSGTTDESSSSDDDDDDSEIKNPDLNYINIHNVLESSNQLKGIQYVDLDHNSSSTNAVTVGPNSLIEYNEIDMEKTKALFDAKVTLEKSRKGSDKSESIKL